MKFVLTGFCLLASIFAFSQNTNTVSVDSLKARYNNQTLTFFKGHMAVGENGERIKRGQVRDLFLISPEALKEYDLYRKTILKSAIVSDIGLAFMIAGAIVANNGSKDLAAGLFGFGEGVLIVGIPISFKASKKFSHAVWLRNREVVFH